MYAHAAARVPVPVVPWVVVSSALGDEHAVRCGWPFLNGCDNLLIPPATVTARHQPTLPQPAQSSTGLHNTTTSTPSDHLRARTARQPPNSPPHRTHHNTHHNTTHAHMRTNSKQVTNNTAYRFCRSVFCSPIPLSSIRSLVLSVRLRGGVPCLCPRC